jgi:membrane-associated phospholipid phosphatase
MNFRKVSLSIFCTLWLILVPSLARAIDVNDVNKTDRATGLIMKDAKAYPKAAFEDAKRTFINRDNILLLLLAGGGSIAMHDTGIDERAADHFSENGKMSKDLDKLIETAGNPGTHFIAAGVWYLIAAKKNDDVNLQRSWVMLKALGITGAMTLTLKAAVHNDTPNGKDWAWPSGHTASSFCAASVLDEFYGPKIGIPAYLGAGLVGYRMMESGDHWASDVMFGGILGYLVGHTVAGPNKELKIANFKVQPMVTSLHGNPAAGIGLEKRF